MKHYIYTLSDPITTEVRYVGKTINLKRRYKQHLYDKRDVSHKGSWIISLRNNGLKPIINVIEECNDENWEDREVYWIGQYENLTNHKKGGNAGNDYKRNITKESIEKIRKANLGKTLTPEHKNKISNSAVCRKIEIDGDIYKSIMFASRILNIPKSTIYRRLNNNDMQNYIYLS